MTGVVLEKVDYQSSKQWYGTMVDLVRDKAYDARSMSEKLPTLTTVHQSVDNFSKLILRRGGEQRGTQPFTVTLTSCLALLGGGHVKAPVGVGGEIGGTVGSVGWVCGMK